jgi:hypothetical protein
MWLKTLLLPVLLVMVGASGDPGTLYEEIKYPFVFDIPEGSFLWNVDVCDKLSRLEFDYRPDPGVLILNHVQITRLESRGRQPRSEEKARAIYGDTPYVQDLYTKLRSWDKASWEYNQVIVAFLDSINLDIPHSVLKEDKAKYRNRVVERMASYPYSIIFDQEMGVEFGEKEFAVYSTRPGQRPRRLPKAYCDTVKVEIPRTVSKNMADSIVREIVSFFLQMPEVPHLAFLIDGGVGTLMMGKDTVQSANEQIRTALASGNPEVEGPMESTYLKRMLEGQRK